MSQSKRIATVQTPVIPTVARWVAATPGTISLGQGVVSYGPPPEALEAARKFSVGPAEHRYGLVEGLPSLIAALEEKLARVNHIPVRPVSRVVVTAGSNMGFINAILAIIDQGDEVILPVPYYFNHEMAVVMLGGKAMTVPTKADCQLDLDAIQAAFTPRTRAVVTCSPNNPTGAVYPEADLRAVNAMCRERGAFHIHDEAYESFTFGGARHFSPGSIDDAGAHTISLHSFSKGYGMASWRVGYMTIPALLWDAVNKIQDTNLVCPSGIAQQTALAAVQAGTAYAALNLASIDRTRQLVYRELTRPDVPCDTPKADGAFYYFVRVRSAMDPMTLVERLVREHKVSAMPGSAFGATEGCFLRISYGAVDEQMAAEGIARLTGGLRAIVDRRSGGLKAARYVRGTRTMKIITWNVNGIRARHEQLQALIAEESPDVVCLQEIKADPGKVPDLLVTNSDHYSYWHGAGGYSGVALIIRHSFVTERPTFHHPSFDMENRIVVAELGNTLFASVYVPNGGKDYDAKIRFLTALAAWASETIATGRDVVISGDLNVALEERDVHPKERKPNQIGTRPEERSLLARLFDAGLSDIGRSLDPDNNELFTFWAPWRNLRQRNIGWRIDYVLATRGVAARARTSASRREFGTSDHAPVVVQFES